VTVPEGGVKAGETFQAPVNPPPPQPQDSTAAGAAVVASNPPVTGHWKVGIFDTCDCTKALWWMGCFCAPIVFGQVMQRLGLDALGSKSGDNVAARNTCNIITVVTIICSLVAFLRLPLFVYILVFGTRYRMYMRQKYAIPTEKCPDCVEDCCCVFWCGPCVACQSHRHTHDDTKYKYSCCSATGLDPEAPAIV